MVDILMTLPSGNPPDGDRAAGAATLPDMTDRPPCRMVGTIVTVAHSTHSIRAKGGDLQSSESMGLNVPDGFWDRADVHTALAARDFTSLLVLVRRWAGASQYRIGLACGLSPGRVSKIINGQQRVEKIDLVLRIADGLGMPDRARLILGLAPRSPTVAVEADTRSVDLVAPASIGATTDLLRQIDRLRQDLDRTLATSSGVTASQIEGLVELADGSARLCIVEPPRVMLERLRLDIAEVRDLVPRAARPPIQQGLYGVVAKLAALIADELMVIGDSRQSRMWFATAHFAADQTSDIALRSHMRALAALLPSYYGTPADVVALADQSIAIADDRIGVHRALAHAYRALALAQVSATDDSLASLELARVAYEALPDSDHQDSVFGFSTGRWLFYQGRILSYLGKVEQAWTIHNEALDSYPAAAVGDTAMIYFDRAISFVRNRDLQPGIDLAIRAFEDLPAEHRTELFIRAAYRVLAAVAPSERDAPSVREFRVLLRAPTVRSEAWPATPVQ